MKLTISEIVLNYDVPLVVMAKAEKGNTFVGINFEDKEDGTPCSFYFVQPRRKLLAQFMEQKVDLRYLVTHGSYSRKFTAKTWAELGSEVVCSKLEGSIEEDMLPAPRLFNPNPLPRSQAVSRKKIQIDGRWDVGDLSLFSDLIRDCYSFAHALIKGPTLQLRTAFEHYPWRGGSSSLNFFKEIGEQINSDERVKLTRMQYASPGYIEFSLREDVSELIKDLIEDINLQDSLAKSSYDKARSYLRDKGWLRLAEEDLRGFTPVELVELDALLSELCEAFGLDGYKSNIVGLSRNNVLAGIKILLAFYRRLSKFADYSATGKAVEIFE
ncbi:MULTISPECIES: hypothetical protein [Pseudomonas aeruginosa group]|uniref:hypothetical protein n=1 Tax=Pseudomonas aeruginosa group TaxID=136841 RepID=UPI00053EA5D9|nr:MULTISPECIES: hypothetical protein [Pseudomonas aeruginosa group]PBX74712.1 hypothetical protein CJT74_02795 [Pseudomonas aeruginosa]